MKQTFNQKYLWLCAFLFLLTPLIQAQIFKYTDSPILKAKQQTYWAAQQPMAVNGSEFFVQLSSQQLFNKNNLTLNLPTGELVLNQITTQKNRSGCYQLRGKIAGKSGSFLLVYNPKKETFTGRIMFEEDNWTLMPLGDDLHVLYEPQDFENDCAEPTNNLNQKSNTEEHSHKKQRISPEADTPKNMAGECKIRILVAYSDEVEAAAADITGQIDVLMMQFDDINAASEVDFSVELACVEGVNINEDNALNGDDRWIDLEQFQDDNDGSMDFIHEQRDQYDADMAILLVSQGIPTGEGRTIVGQAYAIGAEAGTAFCIGIWNSSTFTFTHEFGHLLGMRHNTDDNTTPYAYGHGYINDNNVAGTNFRTVMGVGGSCDGACPRIPQWSSNNLTNNGNPTGNTSTSDNSRVGRVAETTAADWESTVPFKAQFRDEVITNDEQTHVYGSATYSTNDHIVEFQSGSRGTVTAGSIIRLMPGFRAKKGSSFRTILDDCTDNALTNDDEISLRENNNDRPTIANQVANLAMQAIPNPVQDMLQVRIEMTEPAAIILELFNVAGTQIYRQHSNQILAIGQHTNTINMTNLVAGAYYLKLTTAEGSITQKVIKLGD